MPNLTVNVSLSKKFYMLKSLIGQATQSRNWDLTNKNSFSNYIKLRVDELAKDTIKESKLRMGLEIPNSEVIKNSPRFMPSKLTKTNTGWNIATSVFDKRSLRQPARREHGGFKYVWQAHDYGTKPFSISNLSRAKRRKMMYAIKMYYAENPATPYHTRKQTGTIDKYGRSKGTGMHSGIEPKNIITELLQEFNRNISYLSQYVWPTAYMNYLSPSLSATKFRADTIDSIDKIFDKKYSNGKNANTVWFDFGPTESVKVTKKKSKEKSLAQIRADLIKSGQGL